MKTRVSWGLDLGTSALKLVKVVDSGGTLQATTYGPVPVRPPGPQGDLQQELTEALTKLLQLAGARPSSLHCCLPRHAATVKFPELPKADKDQLAGMVRLDAQRYIPFPLEEVVLGYIDLSGLGPEDPSAEPRANGEGAAGSLIPILLIAVRQEIVRRYRSVVSTVLHRPSSLSISSLGTWQLYLHAAAKGQAPARGAHLLLDVGGHSTTVTVVRDGVLVFSRSVGIGGDALTAAFASTYGLEARDAEMQKATRGLAVLESDADAEDAGPPPAIEDWYGRLLMEVRRSMAAFSAEQRHLQVDGVYLSGGCANLPGFPERLQADLGLEVRSLESGGLCRDPQFAEATGQALLGLAPSFAPMDLVPEEEVRRAAQARRRVRLQLASVVALALLAVAGVWGAGVVQRKSEEAQRVRQAEALASKEAKRVSALKSRRDKLHQQLTDVQTALRPQFTWLDVLQDISTRTPQDAWLTGVTLEKGKRVVLRGNAKTLTSPSEMAANLGESPVFSDVNLGYANEARVGNQSVVSFSITGEVRGNLPKPKKSSRTRTRRTAASTTGTVEP